MDNLENNSYSSEQNEIEVESNDSSASFGNSEQELPLEKEVEENNTVENENATFENVGQSPFVNSFEKIEVSPVVPIIEKKPMSKGLKVFAAIMALVILMTGSCAVGFFIGNNKNSNSKLFTNLSTTLSSKPKNTDEKTSAQVYEEVTKSIVGIIVYNQSGSSAIASGVIYSKDGYVVTNDHIYSEVTAPKFKIYDYKGEEYDAEYVAGDSISDLSLLKIKGGKDFTVPTFGDSSELICGENVVAIGRPNDARADSSITKGIISHTKRRMQTTSNYSATLIQTDSAINPGSSGGALVNMYGQIVGITSSKLAGVEYDSMCFAIPTTTMERVVSQLSKNGKVEDRAKLGITYKEITSVDKELGDYKTTGLYIATVSNDSDLFGVADKGDIITKVNGKEITRADDILDVIEQSKAGDTITLTILNENGNSKDYEVKLKANVGESSYSLEEDNSKKPDLQQTPNNNDDNGSNGTFDFPKGE